jgi:hypothetical protein
MLLWVDKTMERNYYNNFTQEPMAGGILIYFGT